jgi:hypothetical protein
MTIPVWQCCVKFEPKILQPCTNSYIQIFFLGRDVWRKLKNIYILTSYLLKIRYNIVIFSARLSKCMFPCKHSLFQYGSLFESRNFKHGKVRGNRKMTLVDFELDTQNSCLFTYITYVKILYMFRALPCSSSGGLHRNCIYAASCIVTLCRWLSCATIKKELNYDVDLLKMSRVMLETCRGF